MEEPNCRVNPVVPRTSETAIGGKLGIDATKKLLGEGFKRSWPRLIKMDSAVTARIEALFR